MMEQLAAGSGQLAEAQETVAELKNALAEMRAAPYEAPFQRRVDLALRLAELYVNAGEKEKARAMLAEETVFAEKIFQAVELTGTPRQKRAAAHGRMQLVDRERQVSLLDGEAPEVAVKTWLQGEATNLNVLRGRVVLLEFWATWCKPCREMFGKLKRIDEEYGARGLEIIGLTRHFFARAGDAASEREELELMRAAGREHGLKFRIGVMEDERGQAIYGATGLPTLVLIDRRGTVRDIRSGSGHERFEHLLSHYLDEQ